jgi:D-tyrosyl-tRNA(Tyr) deacylase
MRACVQRVSRAKVTLPETGEVTGEIGHGILVLLGVREGDSEQDVTFLASKVAQLRIFEDDAGKMNLGLLEVGGEALVVSQFTLYGDCRKGRRPSFTDAARPEVANRLYEQFVTALQSLGIHVATGAFQQEMTVELVNIGPVTLLVDSDHLLR